MARILTENEYIGKLLELPVAYALKFLKENRAIKKYHSNIRLKHGGDLDHIVELNDGSFLHLEDMNFNTKYAYSERSGRVKSLPDRLRKARELYGKVRKTVLIITDCLTASREWMIKNCVEPIIIGEQITEQMDEKRHTYFVASLARALREIIENIGNKTRPKATKLSFIKNFVGKIKSCFDWFTRVVAEIMLIGDAVKWLGSFGRCVQKFVKLQVSLQSEQELDYLIGQKAAEKVGKGWALTTFLREAWGSTRLERDLLKVKSC